MVDSRSSVGVVLGLTLLALFVFAADSAHSRRGASPPRRLFNVLSYGAIPNGRDDNSKAFLRAWQDACKWGGRSSVVVIPKGTYMLNSLRFVGPCRSEMVLQIQGVLRATRYPPHFFTDTWIGFQYINGLVVNGGGLLDGQGSAAWPYNDCSKNPQCRTLPVTMRFDFVSDANVLDLQSVDSKSAHFNLYSCKRMNISSVRLGAPENSPNTDGIRIGNSKEIRISHSVIGTGDDCISMVSGSEDIQIVGVRCGPGHGISIGSLGNNHQREYVQRVDVLNCTFISTLNGVRIKTRPSSFPGFASDITFTDIIVKNVNNPIIIDQKYCPGSNCDFKAQSKAGVRVNNVTFKNIRGTSASEAAISLNCSSSVPCQNVNLVDIQMTYSGCKGRAISRCSNVKGASYGKQLPPSCL